MPSSAPRRVILIDEAQQITGPAGQALLKPLENPPPSTLFILGTMEPEKMLAATKNRCSVFNLEPQDEAGLTKYIKRIVKREELTYVDDAIIKRVVENSNGEFRTAASTLEALDQYAKGSGKKSFTTKDVDAALETTDSNDEELAVRVMACLYAENFSKAHRAIIDVSEPFKFINTLVRLNTFLMNTEVLKGDTHKSIWFSKQNNEMRASVLKVIKRPNMPAFASVQRELLNMKLQSLSFVLPEHALISSTIFSSILSLKALKEST
jgi:DNA polymerase III gamma/tau subunit